MSGNWEPTLTSETITSPPKLPASADEAAKTKARASLRRVFMVVYRSAGAVFTIGPRTVGEVIDLAVNDADRVDAGVELRGPGGERSPGGPTVGRAIAVSAPRSHESTAVATEAYGSDCLCSEVGGNARPVLPAIGRPEHALVGGADPDVRVRRILRGGEEDEEIEAGLR